LPKKVLKLDVARRRGQKSIPGSEKLQGNFQFCDEPRSPLLETRVCGDVGTSGRFVNQAKLSIEHEHAPHSLGLSLVLLGYEKVIYVSVLPRKI
jgi:hypothetical protein